MFSHSLVSEYLLNQWMDFLQTIDASLRVDLLLVTLTSFSGP